MKTPVLRVAVAVSGGRDSTALLHCTLRMAQPLGVDVHALHVHHGLLPEADGWWAQVRRQARRWGAAFDARRLTGKPGRGESVEAWARRERYAALAEMAGAADCSLVLLAHHRQDQAETFLLQALRGGGAAALSSMPALAERRGLVWARPWLSLPRSAIEAYVQRHRLRYVDDASNADPRFARNRLRLQVWPALATAFPEAAVVLCRAADQAQHAAALAAEVAALDVPALCQGDALAQAPWLLLPAARRRNALRAWLASLPAVAAPQSLLDRLCRELPGRHAGAWPAPGGALWLHRGLLRYRPGKGAEAHAAAGDCHLHLRLCPPGDTPVPAWRGHFRMLPTDEGGVPAALLTQTLRVGARCGGERFRLAVQGAARSLKKQYQAAGVPTWLRGGPLLWLPDGRLLFAPGLGVDAALRAAPGQPQYALQWCPTLPGAELSGPGVSGLGLSGPRHVDG